MSVADNALSWAIRIANDPSHGYSQASRWGNPDYDCSSFVISAYKAAGVPINTAVVNYTGNMSGLLQYGFKDVTSSVNLNNGAGLQPGDILWYHLSGTSGHTALYVGNGQIVHARGQSYGSSRPGDQGTEIAITGYSRSKWQHVYRYAGGGASVAVQPSQKTSSQWTAKRYPVSAQLPILKLGTVSRAVAVWQKIIGVESDGDFGVNTNNATVQFQKTHGLETDGEVGPLTWAAGLNII